MRDTSHLSPEQKRVLVGCGTEPPFSGEYVDHHEAGMYACAWCKTQLFSSDTKFDSGSGWPSFFDVVDPKKIHIRDDWALGMHRLEVRCAACDGHLGHVFDDGPTDKTGKRYCINSAALSFSHAPSKT